jgi:tetratricopeptide (TPR) repeat protein
MNMQATKLSEYEITMERALTASKMNDSETAINLFQAAAVLEPAAAIPHFLIAAEYMELKQIDSAEAAYATTILLAPSLHIARFQLGLLFATSNRGALALITWEPLLKLDEQNSLRLFVEGFASILLNDQTKAISLIEQGIQLNLENAPLNVDMNRVLADLRQQISRKENEIDVRKNAETKTDVSSNPNDTATHDTSEDHVNHFLLNNYQQQGPLH